MVIEIGVVLLFAIPSQHDKKQSTHQNNNNQISASTATGLEAIDGRITMSSMQRAHVERKGDWC